MKPELGNFQGVHQVEGRNGNPVKNQFVIQTDKGLVFQSYRAIIAAKLIGGEVLLDKHYWNYSRTTGKYRNWFLDENKEETSKKIESGEYKLVDLN